MFIRLEIVALICYNYNMKNIRININKYIRIIILVALFLVATISTINTSSALANETIIFTCSATTTDYNSNVTEYDLDESNLTYKRAIEVTFGTNAPKYKIKAEKKSDYSWEDVYIGDIENVEKGVFKYSPSASGKIKITATIYNVDDIQLDEKIITVLSDNTIPSVDFDTKQFEDYHINEFNVEFTLIKKQIGEIDFSKSVYSYKDGDVTIIPPTKILDYSTKQIKISKNGVLIFDIYDKSGNYHKQSFVYDRYGTGEFVVPTITKTPNEGWAKKVLITMSWGDKNDFNPNVLKRYAVYDGSTNNGVIRNYTGPFYIETSGSIEVRAYYKYANMEEMQYEKTTVNNVDSILPSIVAIKETIGYKVTLDAEVPVVLSFRATDNIGIKRVWDCATNIEFEKGNNSYYFGALTEQVVNIGIEDFAGNYIEYQYVNRLNFNIIKTYNKKILEMNKSLYSQSLLDELKKNVSELNMLFMQTEPSMSDIDNLLKKIDKNILGEFQKKTFIENGLSGYSTNFVYNIQMDNFTAENILLGELFILNISYPEKTNAINAYNLDLVKNICGFKKSTAYTFNLRLSTSSHKSLTLIKPVPITYTFDSEHSGKKIKVYYEKNGLILEAKSSYINNILFFDMENNTDYYFVIEEPATDGNFINNGKGFVIKGKLYSYGLVIGVSIGIIIVLVVLSLILFRKQK